MAEPAPENDEFYRVEVVAPARRCRHFSSETKAALVAEASRPGAVVAEIARRHDLDPSQLFRWRADARQRARELREIGAMPQLSAPTLSVTPTNTMTEIEVDGVKLRIPGGASRETIWATAEAVICLARRGR